MLPTDALIVAGARARAAALHARFRALMAAPDAPAIAACAEFGGCIAVRKPAFARLQGEATTGATWNAEVRRRDGRRVPVQVRTRTTVNPSDSEPLVVVAFEDLSAQRLLEEQVRRADRLRSLGQLSAAIAHEVRNPLQGISLTL